MVNSITEKTNVSAQAGSSLNVHAVASIIILLAAYCINFPSLSIRAEPYAETITNYFDGALHQTLVSHLLAPDFVYRPILPHLLSFLTVRIFGAVAEYPRVVQLLTLFAIASASSLVNIRGFRALISSDRLRFLLGLILGLHYGYGMFHLHNLGYWGIFPLFLLLFVEVEKFPIWGIAAALFVGMTIFPAKPFALSLLPFYFLNSVISFRRDKKASLFYVLCGLSGLYLAANVLGGVGAVSGDGGKPSFPTVLIKVWYFYFFSFGNVLFGRFSSHSFAAAVAFSSLGICLLVLAQLILYKRKDYRRQCFLPVANLAALACVALTVVGFRHDPIDVLSVPTFPDDSHFFFSDALIFLSIAFSVGALVSIEFLSTSLLLVLSFTSNVFGFVRAKDPYAIASESPSAWRTYSAFLSDPDYCIPINPEGWFYRKDCWQLAPNLFETREVEAGRTLSVQTFSGQNTPPGIRLRLIEVVGDAATEGRLEAVALNAEGKPLASITQNSPLNRRFVVFKFDSPVEGLARIDIRSLDGPETILEHSKVLLFGQVSDPSQTVAGYLY